ncbi:hypothetical protein [Roseateles aquatilis]|uniref:hypothetical protein n=1 Tax=Roseateles aquatilis TaxID=431061 RepID=UPI0011319CF8|nr:hypothetical protein [Roseateles aquatilis]
MNRGFYCKALPEGRRNFGEVSQIKGMELAIKEALLSDYLSTIARHVLDEIWKASAKSIKWMVGESQSSFEFAKIYRLRQGIGYFDARCVEGLAESILALSSRDRMVALAYASVGAKTILAFIEIERQEVVGLMIFSAADCS